MTAISSASLHGTGALRHSAPTKPAAPVRANDGDADDAPRAPASAKLASTGPGQIIDRLA